MGSSNNKNSNDKDNNNDKEKILENKYYSFSKNKKVTFKFNYFKESYEKINFDIQNFKTILKIETQNEISIIILKTQKIFPLILDEKIKENLTNLNNIYQIDYINFIYIFKEIKRIQNVFYSISQNYISNCLKHNNLMKIDDEKRNENSLSEEINKLYKKYNKLKKKNSIINEILKKFEFNNNNQNNNISLNIDYYNISLLNNYYKENYIEINKIVNFKDEKDNNEIKYSFANFRAFINNLFQMKNFFEEKNKIILKLIDIFNNISNLYFNIIDSIQQNENENNIIQKENNFHDKLYEFKEFSRIIIKHRYINHLDEIINKFESNKKLDDEKNNEFKNIIISEENNNA